METLEGVATGRYTVTTVASEYLLDLDRRVIQRFPDPNNLEAAGLRRDAEEIVLVEVVSCEVGQSMVLLIDLDILGVLVTTRRTTPIVAIERFLDSLSDASGS